MKHTAVWVLAAGVAGSVAIDFIADLTQTRPDPRKPDHRTEIVYGVKAKRTAQVDEAASALWGACHGTVHRRVLPPGVESLGDGRFRITVQPALGRHARDRLTGCLEDLTLDRIKGSVVSMRELPPEAPG